MKAVIDDLEHEGFVPPDTRAQFIHGSHRHERSPSSKIARFPGPPPSARETTSHSALVSMLTDVIGKGPAAMVFVDIPDYHAFRGSFGGRHIIPLWKDASATVPNVTEGLLNVIATEMDGSSVTTEDLFAYCYALMATPEYVEKYWDELTIPGPRIPITKGCGLFNKVAMLGRELIHLHTYGERCLPEGATLGTIPEGRAEYTVGIPADEYPAEFSYDEATETISIGKGRYTKVLKEVWEYSISGYQPVKSWLDYRKLKRSGKSGSPLDSIRPKTWPDADGTEFLSLLWIVEHTIGKHAYATALLHEVADSEIFTAAELPQPVSAQAEAPVEIVADSES